MQATKLGRLLDYDVLDSCSRMVHAYFSRDNSSGGQPLRRVSSRYVWKARLSSTYVTAAINGHKISFVCPWKKFICTVPLVRWNAIATCVRRHARTHGSLTRLSHSLGLTSAPVVRRYCFMYAQKYLSSVISPATMGSFPECGSAQCTARRHTLCSGRCRAE